MAEDEVKGMDQLIKNFSKFSERLVREIVFGCEAVQQKVVNSAQSKVPTVTHHLQESIRAGGIIIEDENVTALVGANAEYAGFVEGVDKDWNPIKWNRRPIPKMTPYLGPALLENKEQFVKAMSAAVKRAEESIG